MADLDDFFKKRDKKKKTAKSKFSVLDTEEFAKQLEVRNVDLDDGEFQDSSEQTNSAGNNLNSNENHDEEWKPFDSDENKDYSNLRINIQKWKVGDEEEIDEEAVDDTDKKASCPWAVNQSKMKHQQQQQQQEQEQEQDSQENKENEEEVPKKKSENIESEKSDSTASTTVTSTTTTTTTTTAAAAPTGAYVPPGLRRQMEASKATGDAKPVATTTTTSSSEKYVPPSMRNLGSTTTTTSATSMGMGKSRKDKSVNIMDTLEFPTLDATGAAEDSKMTNGTSNSANDNSKFEVSKKGGRVDTKTSKNSMIDLENKFTALSNSNQ